MSLILKEETKKIMNKISAMLDGVVENHKLASEALKNLDKDLAQKVIENDVNTNMMHANIRSDVEFMLAKAPVAKTLRKTLSAIQIIKDVERVGDYAKHIATFIIKNEVIAKSSVNRLMSIHKTIIKALESLKIALENLDDKLALKIIEEDKAIDKQVAKMRSELISSIVKKQSRQEVKERVYLFQKVSVLERAGDHIINICVQINYIINGDYEINEEILGNK